MLAGGTGLPAATVTLNPAVDAYVNDSAPNDTFNTAWLVVGHSPAEFTPRYRSFLRFSLSGIPSNATVSSAVLRLNLQAIEGGSAATVELRRVLAAWSSTTLTWNNQPATTTPVATTTVGATIGATYNWSIAGLAQGWVSGQYNNDGLALFIANEATATTTRTFASGNHATASLRPELVVTYALAPDIAVTPTALPFGDQRVGTASVAQNVTVLNSGGSTLWISNVTSSSSQFKIEGLPPFPASLNPGFNGQFQVRFAPTSVGAKSGTVSILSNDPDEAKVSLPCTGTGVAPAIGVEPGSLLFAMRAVGTVSPPQNLAVRNDGTAPLIVRSIASDTMEFQVSGLPALPLVLASGAGAAFQVRFAPLTAGSKNGRVRFQSDDPLTPLVEVPCDGVGSTGPQQAPTLAAEYAAYAMPATPTGGVSAAQAVFVVNNSSQPRQITGIGSLPSGSPFRMLNRVAPLPAIVPPGGRIKVFDVQFAPAELGIFEEAVQLLTDVPALNPIVVRLTGRSRHPSLPDFYSDPRPFHIAFDQLKYSAGANLWLSYAGSGPDQIRIYLASPARDDIEAIDLVRAGVGPSCRQVQRVMLGDSSAGHFDGTLAARPGDFIFAFFYEPNANRTVADYAFVSGGPAQGLFSLAIDPALTPQPSMVAGRPGETARGLAAIADTRNYPGVFGDDQLIIEPRDLAELNDFLKRYGGRIVDDGRRSAPNSRAPRPYYLVRVNLDRADTTDFSFMAELAGVRSALRTSSAATRKLYSILIHEQLEGRRVTLNPRVEYFGQPVTAEGAGLAGGSTDAFGLNYVSDCVQKVNRAWSYVALQDRDRDNGVTVRLAVIDDGFCTNPDLPMAADGGWDLVEDDGDPTGPRVTVFGADWHGSSVASTAASLPNNALGSAGGGGQVAELMFYRLGNLGHAFEVGVALDLAVADGAQVVNMSFGIPCRVFGGPTFCEIDNIEFWLGLVFLCPLVDATLEAALDLVAPFIPVRVTCEEFYFLMAAARSSMLAGVEDALDAGVCLVASSGNGIGGVPDSDIGDFDIIPASFRGVIAVGAMDANYQNTEFFGNRVDVWAMMPVRAYAPPANANNCAAAPVIANFGQTSGGSGFVAGIVALMRALNPGWTPADIRTEIRALPDPAPDGRVQRPLDAYQLVHNAGLAAGLPDLELVSPGLGFDESIPAGFGCLPAWPPSSHASDDTPPTANTLVPGANVFVDRAIHPFRTVPGQEADLYRYNVPANLPANAAYDVEAVTTYPTAAGALLPHPEALIAGIGGGLSTATYARSGLFLRDDLYLGIQGNDPVLANQDNVYALSVDITRHDLQADRYDRPPLGNPPNDRFADATTLPNPAGGDEWEFSRDGVLRTWRMRVRNLNFHTPNDMDYFCVALPPEALNDCNSENDDCPFDAVRGLSSGRLVIRVIGASEVIKLNGQGDEVERAGHYLEYGCLETSDRNYFAVVGSPEVSRSYEIRITYTFPDEGAGHFFGDLCDAWRPLPPPDPRPDGGFDILNPGQSDPQEFWLGLPCNPIVCDPPLHDYLMFNWNRSDRFSLEFQHAASDLFAFELIDVRLNVLGRAEPVNTLAPAAGNTALPVTLRLEVSSLPAGFYLIRVTGNRVGSAYTARFLTPASPTLEISRGGASGPLTIAWPRAADGFVLEEAATLSGATTAWSPVGLPYQTNATHISVTVEAPVGHRFYRLRQP